MLPTYGYCTGKFLVSPLPLAFPFSIYFLPPFVAESSSLKGDAGPDCDGGTHSRLVQRSSLFGLLVSLSSQRLVFRVVHPMSRSIRSVMDVHLVLAGKALAM